ncbi:MAG: hypothetical protein KAW56_07040 [Candidatus Marinimicrobia bacterium]|nr:hypothetical protein [Candidatus Neomarinimicrobiota bacterium]
MTDHNAIILRIIKSYVGEPNMRTQAQITDECIARGGTSISERMTRRILRELIDNGAPIISTPKGGYYWYSCEAERIECYKRLRHKGISILVRARRMNRNCKAERDRRQEREQLSLLGVG